jgi:hypothetical protein
MNGMDLLRLEYQMLGDQISTIINIILEQVWIDKIDLLEWVEKQLIKSCIDCMTRSSSNPTT